MKTIPTSTDKHRVNINTLYTALFSDYPAPGERARGSMVLSEGNLEMGWSRNVLIHQIQSRAYERHWVASKQHNFQEVRPKHLAEQADEVMKDVYV